MTRINCDCHICQQEAEADREDSYVVEAARLQMEIEQMTAEVADIDRRRDLYLGNAKRYSEILQNLPPSC